MKLEQFDKERIAKKMEKFGELYTKYLNDIPNKRKHKIKMAKIIEDFIAFGIFKEIVEAYPMYRGVMLDIYDRILVIGNHLYYDKYHIGSI